MTKKILFAMVLAVIFACGQTVLAADINPIYNKDEKAFIADFNKVASKLGAVTVTSAAELIDKTDNGYELYAVEMGDSSAMLIQRSPQNQLTMLVGLFKDKDAATKASKAILMTLGLTESEMPAINFGSPAKTVAVKSAAANRTFNVEMEDEAADVGHVFTITITAQ